MTVTLLYLFKFECNQVVTSNLIVARYTIIAQLNITDIFKKYRMDRTKPVIWQSLHFMRPDQVSSQPKRILIWNIKDILKFASKFQLTTKITRY